MRWSIKSLLLYITAICVCLGLTWLPAGIGALALMLVVSYSRLWIPSAMWRLIAFAAFVGAVASCLLVIHRCLELHASTQNEAIAAPAFYERWLPYAIQLGAFLGGSIGLLLYSRKQQPSEASL
jgi:hypothetical protein